LGFAIYVDGVVCSSTALGGSRQRAGDRVRGQMIADDRTALKGGPRQSRLVQGLHLPPLSDQRLRSPPSTRRPTPTRSPSCSSASPERIPCWARAGGGAAGGRPGAAPRGRAAPGTAPRCTGSDL